MNASHKNSILVKALSFEWNTKSIVKCMIIILSFWLPYIVILFPGEITFDGYNQLYQFSNAAPTWYSTMDYYVDAEYIDHHPLFDTLLYGLFVYVIGGAIGAKCIGFFALALLQTVLSAFALASSVCYLCRFDCPRPISLLLLLFFSLFPVFPIYAMTVLKDSLHAPFVLLFFISFCEVMLRCRGDDLRKTDILHLAIASFGCALTKKTGIAFVFVSLLALALASRERRLAPLLTSVLVVPLAFPSVMSPLLGGVAPGGRQEALGVFLQQTTAITLEFDQDISPRELDAINAVFDYRKAQDSYREDSVDPVKRTFRPDATDADLVNYLFTWAAHTLRYPGYSLDVVLKCNGSLYVPGDPIAFRIGSRIKDADRFRRAALIDCRQFDPEIDKFDYHAELAQRIDRAYKRITSRNALMRLLFSKGLYGGLLPIICCLVLSIAGKGYRLLVVPITLLSAILLLCPVGDGRYILPHLYIVPMITVASCLIARASLFSQNMKMH